eukprot:TRINITY_DN1436_c0_g1_i2.p1 TRINITY_DN1436_c0_g1~~TRINITY_DN1436_c0_g1_i2.p1  ORF type:complete len:1331 (+),score=257.60 TRINITY_DN1436_c0_g1_i2:141-4133(+)
MLSLACALRLGRGANTSGKGRSSCDTEHGRILGHAAVRRLLSSTQHQQLHGARHSLRPNAKRPDQPMHRSHTRARECSTSTTRTSIPLSTSIPTIAITRPAKRTTGATVTVSSSLLPPSNVMQWRPNQSVNTSWTRSTSTYPFIVMTAGGVRKSQSRCIPLSRSCEPWSSRLSTLSSSLSEVRHNARWSSTASNSAGTPVKKATRRKTTTKRKTMKPKKKAASSTAATATRKEASASSAKSVEQIQQSLEDVYQRMSPLEHILVRPDTYVGSTQWNEQPSWIMDRRKNSDITTSTQTNGKKASTMKQRKLKMEPKAKFIPGLYKIFDEILVNATDNKQRDPTGMSTIRVDIDRKQGKIRVFNDGRGIPVTFHSKEGMYIPELVLGHLLTGSNFDDSIAKVTGGRNGYGAKLANVMSESFSVETYDSSQGLRYSQQWRKNMTEVDKPTVVKMTPSEARKKKGIKGNGNSDYTEIMFKPDLKVFGMTSLGQHHTMDVLLRRVHDVAACNEALKVYLNGELLLGGFENYVQRFPTGLAAPTKKEKDGVTDGAGESEVAETGGDFQPFVSVKLNDRWEVCIGESATGQFSQVSFVNSINTLQGGTHVTAIADQVISALQAGLAKKTKKEKVELSVPAASIKNHLFVAVNCLIENPSFDSQTKEALTTKPELFGSNFALSDSFLKRVLSNTSLLQTIMSYAKFRASRVNARRTQNRSKLLAIDKLDDANNAGTAKAEQCTLILTEGDSAKALAVSGLSVIGRDNYGVFPLRGKLLNVRNASKVQLKENAEIQKVIKILGLRFDKTYRNKADRDQLRYGKVMLMTDQDYDGFHIKGLFINFVHYFWPELLKSNDFLEVFVTPLVKAHSGNKKKTFFLLKEYEDWKTTLPAEEAKQWTTKYYKGLGTSTSVEARVYFSNLGTHRVPFLWQSPDRPGRAATPPVPALLSTANLSEVDSVVELAFGKYETEARKRWLQLYDGANTIDYSDSSRSAGVSLNDFFNCEMILFSIANNVRAIPSMIDGLKPGQRKIMHACLQRKPLTETKVSQLAAYVSEKTNYLHGEASLQGTIVGMAQSFVGSNNIPLLEANGQFGTRLDGGKDSASARYIYTKLTKSAPLIFHNDDTSLLERVIDDGVALEPTRFIPVLPLILVNGCEGVGTGWMTKVPSYNPLEVIDNLLRKLDGEKMTRMQPWYNGFTGDITPESSSTSSKFVSFGKAKLTKQRNSRASGGNKTVTVSELPVGRWTNDFKRLLLKHMQEPAKQRQIVDLREHHTENTVKFVITLSPDAPVDCEEDAIKFFGLSGNINANNMFLFDASGKIRRYSSPLEIIDHFYPLR